MWYISEQDLIEDLNEAVNRQWDLVRHLEAMSRWNKNGALRDDVQRLRDITEAISELLNEAIVYDLTL